MSAVPKTMKAWVSQRVGAPRTALHLSTSHAAPTPPTGSEITIRITYAALNPVDLVLMSFIPSWLPFRRNPVSGMDFAGEVVALGPAVSPEFGLALGSKVAGALSVAQKTAGKGSLAEYMTIPADLVARIPQRLTEREAVGLIGVAGQTAAVVINEAGVGDGHRLLVNGASGGVGSVLVQLASARGARVYGICSGANAALVTRLGAVEAVDYKAHAPVSAHLAERFGAADAQFDFVVDCVGDQALFAASPGFLKPAGRFLCIVGGWSQGVLPYVRNNLRPTLLGGVPRSYLLLGLSPNGPQAREIAEWVEKGEVKEAVVDSEFAMEDVLEAYDKLVSKRAKGKVIVKVAS